MIVPKWSEELVKEAIFWHSTTMTRQKSLDHVMEPQESHHNICFLEEPLDNVNLCSLSS
jgi:hypothetical protein